MKYMSFCSGIEAVSVAWKPLGWEPLLFAETDTFCSALLAQRFPGVPNVGDITRLDGSRLKEVYGTPDIVVAGTPCQPFSIAGHRLGVSDARGNVTLHFFRLVGEIRPQWVVWENVPGILSSDNGTAFHSILMALDEFGYGVAWRVLDAQGFGVPQQRRRLYLVGYRGDWRPAASVLFEPEGGGLDTGPGQPEREADPAPHPADSGTDCGYCVIGGDGCVKPISGALVALYARISATTQFLVANGQIRMFTPLECERLQGLPDGWTAIDWRGHPAPNTLRYQAIGNSMAVPVMRWIGERIQRSMSHDDTD